MVPGYAGQSMAPDKTLDHFTVCLGETLPLAHENKRYTLTESVGGLARRSESPQDPRSGLLCPRPSLGGDVDSPPASEHAKSFPLG